MTLTPLATPQAAAQAQTRSSIQEQMVPAFDLAEPPFLL
jgi:hypothetical protein